MHVIGHPARGRPERLDQPAATTSVVPAAYAREVLSLDAAPNCLQRAKEVLVTTVAVLATTNRSEPAAKGSKNQSLELEMGDAIRHRSEFGKCRLSHRPAGRSTPQEASANCGNALIGESVDKWASDGGPCPPSQIAPIAAMSRLCESTACSPSGGTSRSDSESSATVRIRSAAKRESGALIRGSGRTAMRSPWMGFQAVWTPRLPAAGRPAAPITHFLTNIQCR